MYYHELVNAVTKAIKCGDTVLLDKVERKTRDLLLSSDEVNAILDLVEVAYQAIEAIGENS